MHRTRPLADPPSQAVCLGHEILLIRGRTIGIRTCSETRGGKPCGGRPRALELMRGGGEALCGSFGGNVQLFSALSFGLCRVCAANQEWAGRCLCLNMFKHQQVFLTVTDWMQVFC